MKKPLLFGIILTVCVIIVAFVFAQVYPEGMISYWKFDESEGTIAYNPVNGNDGTIYGATWTTGQVNGALNFNGLDDYVEIPDDNSLDITGDLTLEAWIEPDSVSYTAQGEIIGKWVQDDTSYWFAIRDGELQMRISANGTDYYNIEETSNANLSIDTWYHVVGVYDASAQDIKLYINGVVEESTTVKGTIPSSIHSGSANVKIGGWWPGYHFDGKIDEVAIYNRALLADEIQWHYQDGLHGLGYDVECFPPPDGMVSWWPGDGNADDIIGENDGSLQGDATFATGRVGQAFSFDGIDDYVQVADGDNLDVTELTIDAWVKGQDSQFVNGDGIIWKFHSYVLQYWNGVVNPGVFVGDVWCGTGWLPSATIWDNNWHHIALTYDGTVQKFYVDGDLKGSNTRCLGPIDITSSDLRIGSDSREPPRYYTGAIDEVEIFNHALTASEIQDIYLAGSAGKCKITNQPPVAVCKDIEIPVVENCQSASITAEDVDGGSTDPDEGDTITLSIDNVGPFFSLGDHSVNLTVTDDSGESDTCLAIVTVVDTIPPIIESFTVDPNVLWPPNHKMVLITPTTINVSDNCDPNPEIVLTITMNEGDEEDTYNPILDSILGDGHTTNDMQVIDGLIYLRAERSGKGDGRIYIITYTATDISGNSATATAIVTVPHDQE